MFVAAVALAGLALSMTPLPGAAAATRGSAALVMGAGDTTIINGPVNPLDPRGPVLTVVQTPQGEVRVDNPGVVAPVDQQCIGLPNGRQTCLGASGQIKFGNGAQSTPIRIQSNDLYGERTRENLGWIIDEARLAIASMHGVRNDDLVDTYARPEIRSYVAVRLQTILEKKLYGAQLTDQETQTYDWLMRQLNARETARAKDVLAEYDRWEADPCGYAVPAPPAGSGLSVVPNPVAATANCHAANGVTQLFKYTKGTPGIETFEAWAAYRHPTAMMRSAGDAVLQQMNYNTVVASTVLTGLGAATVAAGAAFFAVASSAALASAVTAVTGVAFFIPLEAATVAGVGGSFGYGAGAVGGAVAGATAAAAAGAILTIVLAIVAIGVSSWMLAQEADTANEIRQRAQSAGTNEDPLGIVADQERYRGLDQRTLQNPSTGTPALIHSAAFNQQLMGMVQEWLVFDGDGHLVPDPQTPFDPASAEPGATAGARFTVDGAQSDSLSVKAPPSTVDNQGRPVSGYDVRLSHGWLLVSDSVRGVQQPARPVSALNFVDAQGQPAVMSLISRAQAQGGPRDAFLIVHAPSGAPLQSVVSDTWTFTGAGDVVQTARIDTATAVLPAISLLPTVTADAFYPGRLLTFQSNVSKPGQQVPGRYSWVVEHLGDDGQVLSSSGHSISENLLGFQDRFTEPGSYRATVHYSGLANGAPFDSSGTVTFTIAQPQPTVMDGALRDELALHGSLSLNLRLQEPVDHDTLGVDVQWADDALGQTVSRHYTVNCRPLGDGGCDTDSLVSPEDAPTNSNWSQSPTYTIPDDQAYLPQVTATVTNGFAQKTTLVLQAPGEHRPRYVDRNPTVQMVAGTPNRVRVTEVRPTLLAGDPVITVLPFIDTIQASLPVGVQAGAVEDNGHWYLELDGEPRADDIGPHTFYFPVEQQPVGMGLRPSPALVTLDVVPSTTRGYRAVLRKTPAQYADRVYRTGYPDYVVQVMQTTADGEPFAPFEGTVMCQLTGSGTLLMRQPCTPDRQFPWPATLTDDNYVAEVWVESSSQPVVPEHYSVSLGTLFLQPRLTMRPAAATDSQATVELAVSDHRYSVSGVVPAPFAAHGYTVTCSMDGAAFVPCLDGGTMTVPHSAGSHRLLARVTAPDGATVDSTLTWSVASPATRITVARPVGSHRAGGPLLVLASGLLPGEAFRVLVAGRLVGTGTAAGDGTLRATVTIPVSTAPGLRPLVVYGATDARRGQSQVRVLRSGRGPTVSNWWWQRPSVRA